MRRKIVSRFRQIGLASGGIFRRMLHIHRHKLTVLLSAIALVLCSGVCHAQDMDAKILQKALNRALGERTSEGTRRLVSVEQKLEARGKVLLVGVVANDSPTLAGFRHGIYKDAVTVLRVLKSWGWPSKVDKAIIAAYYAESKGPNMELRPVFKCIVSPDTIRRYDWNAFDPGKIPEIADDVQIDDMLK